METLHRLRLSVGEIVALAHGVRRQLQGEAGKLVAQVRGEPVVHQDETGWREDGQNGFVWVTATAGAEVVRYSEYSASRSHHVAKGLLGADFRGVLVSDFYAAYQVKPWLGNLIPGRHQRCWAHLLRDLHQLKEEQPYGLTCRSGLRPCANPTTRLRPGSLPRLHPPQRNASKPTSAGSNAFDAAHPCWALAKRLLRHQEELFQFVLVPGLPADSIPGGEDNNLAERSLRPLVVIRKISGGTRSPQGTKTRLTLASLLGTWAAPHLNPFLQCLAALQQSAPTAPT
ncbi:MAG: transposase [Anaerolineae bacterium]|nr:transposase [Anaerolineae bacterium]